MWRRLLLLIALGWGPMPYDSCAAALAVTLTPGTPYSATFDTTGNASDPTITADCLANDAGANALWLKVTSPIDSAIIVDTHGSDYDTEALAFSGECGSLALLDCGEDDGIDNAPSNNGWQSTVDAIPVQAGVPVYLAFADYDEVGGDLVVNIQLADPTIKRYVLSEDGWRGEQIAYSTDDGARVAQGGLRRYGETPDEGGFDADLKFAASLNGNRLYKVHDDASFSLQAYDRVMQPLPYAVAVGSSTVSALCTDAVGNVYARGANGGGDLFLAKYTADLAFVERWPATPSVAEPSEAVLIAVSPDESILYYKKEGAPNQGKIFRYDLNASAPLTNLATLPVSAGSNPDFLLNLFTASNGDVIAVGAKSDDLGITPDDFLIHRYSAAGSLLSTVVMPEGSSSDALDPDGLSLWYLADDNTVTQILISDGTILDAFPIDPDASPGSYLAIMAEAVPVADYVIAEIRGAERTATSTVTISDGVTTRTYNRSDAPIYRIVSLQTDGTDLFIKIPAAFRGEPTVEVYRVKHGYSQRYTKADARSKIEMRGSISSFDTKISKADGWLELRINGRVYNDGDDYDLIDPTSQPTGCRNTRSGLNMHNGFGWSIGMVQNTFLDCCYLNRSATYCRQPDTPGPPGGEPPSGDDGEQGPCAPPGPGGSSFDGAADGDRVVQPGGFPATYVPPDGEGEVASADDPEDPQDLATLRVPLVSLDLTLCDESVLRLAKSTFPRPGQPQFDPRVLHWPEIPYPIADRFGNLAAQTWQVELADEDGYLRGLLDSGPNRFYKRWLGDLFVEDNDTGRLQGLDRQRLARGRCVSVRSGSTDQGLVLVFSDEYSRHDSVVSLDRPLPRYLIGDLFRAGASSPDLPSVPRAAEDVAAQAATIIMGEGSDEYRSAENPPVTPIGVCKLHDLGDVSLGSEVWRAFFVCHHPVYSVAALFGSNLDPTCPASVRLDPALYNGDGETHFLVPGYSPWDAYFANPYIEVTVNGKTHWCTVIFGRGPITTQHTEGKVPLSANVNGMMADSGLLIDDGARILQQILDVRVLRDVTSGAWGAVATFPDGIAMLRTSDIEAIKTLHDAQLSTRVRGAVIIDQQRAAKDWIAAICVSYGIRHGLNHHGQMVFKALNLQASLSNLRTFTDLAHIRDGSFQLTSELNAELENALVYDAGPEPASGRLTVAKTALDALDSIRDWGDGESYPAQPLTLVGVNRPEVAAWAAANRLILTQDGITRGAFVVDLAGGSLRGFELVRLTHFAGIGSTGWRNRVLLATDRYLNSDDESYSTRVNFEDAHVILVQPGSEDEPAFGSGVLGSEDDETADFLGSEVAGTAHRLG